MNPAANVTSVAGMADFQAALASFADRAKDALTTADLELRRLIEWLQDQAQHWKAEIRAAEDAVIEAKAELTRKKMMPIGDRKPDTTQEEKMLARAQAWLEHSQEMLERTRRWQQRFPDDLLDYEGPARQLKFLLEAQAPRMAAFLTEKIEALQSYQQLG